MSSSGEKALNLEQVPIQEQCDLRIGLSHMEKLLKSKKKESKPLKQWGNSKLQGTRVGMLGTKCFTVGAFPLFNKYAAGKYAAQRLL